MGRSADSDCRSGSEWRVGGLETRIASVIAGTDRHHLALWMVGWRRAPWGERCTGTTIAAPPPRGRGIGGAALLFAPDAGSQSIYRNLVFGFVVPANRHGGWSFGP